MKIQILASTQVNGIWYEPGSGDGEYPDDTAKYLISIGSARAVITKVVKPTTIKAPAPAAPAEEVVQNKGKKSSAASRPARASGKATAKRSKKPASSRSRSTTTTK